MISSHELAAHVELRRTLDVLDVVARDLIAQLSADMFRCGEEMDHARDNLVASWKTAVSIHAAVRFEPTCKNDTRAPVRQTE